MIQLIGPALAGARAIGGAANIARYAMGTGATLAGLLGASSANAGRQQTLQGRPVVNPEFLRPDYSGAGERARRFQEYKTGRDIPGASTDYSERLSGFSPAAAERAYQSEKASVAQQAAQNPELKRYEDARLKAVAPGATPEAIQSAEDIGMQMWAKANPTLAAKVKPGQSGYDVIQSTLAGSAARQGFGYGLGQQLVPTPQGFPSLPLPMGSVAPGGYAQGFNVQQNLAPNVALPAPSAPTATQSNLGAAFGAPGTLDDETIKKFQSLIKTSS